MSARVNINKQKTTEQFIQEAKQKHGDRYDYSKVKYVNANTEITVICAKHGEFPILPTRHLRSNCLKCTGHLCDLNDWIEKAKKVHKEKFDYSKVNYVNIRTEITIICKVHNNEFPILPSSHIKTISGGCKECIPKAQTRDNIPKFVEGKLNSYTTESFIQLSNQVHNNIYNYSETKYINGKTKVTVNCSQHGNFLINSKDHLQGRGCLECSGTFKNAFKYTTEEFIEKCKTVHNNEYDYSKTIYSKGSDIITIICSIHGEYFQQASLHLHGSKCNKCFNKSKKTTEEWIQDAIKIHGFKYDYSNTSYSGAGNVLTIRCPIPNHGDFEQIAGGHIRGSGCPKCAINSPYTTAEFIELVKTFLSDGYDYSKTEYLNAKTNVTIDCPMHGSFYKSPDVILRTKQGCQICSNRRFSEGQIQWLQFLSVSQPTLQYILNGGEYKINNSRYHADGFCPETNTIYEYDGDYYHGNPKLYNKEHLNRRCNKTFGELYQKTLDKRDHCIDNGYNFKSMWESEWHRGIGALKILQLKFKRSRGIDNNASPDNNEVPPVVVARQQTEPLGPQQLTAIVQQAELIIDKCIMNDDTIEEDIVYEDIMDDDTTM